MNSVRRRIALGVAVCAFLIATAAQVAAFAPANLPFQRAWAYTDKPVADGQANRTWMWGPEAFTGAMTEHYEESPGKSRVVQYFDKTRMEITDPNGNPNDLWHVTNGLLVVEMVTGRLQLGDNAFEQRDPARENVAGDADDPTGPTYETMQALLDLTAGFQLKTITQVVDRDGNITLNPDLGVYGIGTSEYVSDTNHWIAKPFWDFMNSSGPIFENGATKNGPLFQNPYYATGFPITDPFWAHVKVGGDYKYVLLQCFERRCLTYTPDNPDGWKVEAGNVGQHYYRWRYDAPADGDSPCPAVEHLHRYYAVDSANDRIQVLDDNGNYICHWGGGEQPGGLERPRVVHVDEHGVVHVLSRGWIQKFDARGGFISAFPAPNFTQDFAIGPDGRYYTTGQSLAKVIVYDEDGVELYDFDGGADKLVSPIGIAVDEDGFVYVVDRGTRYATKFTALGGFVAMFGGPGEAQDGDELDIPTGIAVDPFGRVYIVDSGYVKTFTYQNGAYLADGHWGGMTEDAYAGDARISVFPDETEDDPIAINVGDTAYDTIRGWTLSNGVATLDVVLGEPGSGPGQFNGAHMAVYVTPRN